MKKLFLFIIGMIFTINLNAQNQTLIYPPNKPNINVVDSNSRSYRVSSGLGTGMNWKSKKVISVNAEYMSSIYTTRASHSFTASGVLFLGSLVSASVPLIYNKQWTNCYGAGNAETLSNIFIAISGGCLVSSIVCFISGASSMNNSAIVLRNGGKYSVIFKGDRFIINF